MSDRIAALEARLAAAEARIAALEASRTTTEGCGLCGLPRWCFCQRPGCPQAQRANSPVVVTRFLDGTLTPAPAKDDADG